MAKKDMDENEDDLPEDDDEDDDEDDYEGGWSYRRKFFTVLIAIILIIAAISAIFLLNPNVQQVLVLPPTQLTDRTGINVNVEALLEGTGSASGEGDIKILYNGEVQYSSKLNFKGDEASKKIQYSEFFYDRGEYEIIASFSGETSDSYFFDPGEDFSFGIADHLNVTMALEPNNFELQDDPSKRSEPINIHILAYVRELKTSGSNVVEQNPRAPPRNTKIEITIEHEDGESEPFDITLIDEATATFTDFVYYSSTGGPGSGYYTISAKITNNFVKPDSPKYQITLDDITTQYLNIHPIALHDDSISDSSNEDTTEIEFDASDSWNDGEIVKYIWDFEMEKDNKGNIIFDSEEEFTTAKVKHTYQRTSPLPTSVDTITVGLMIIGDANDPGFGTDNQGKANEEQSTIIEITVTINWLLKI